MATEVKRFGWNLGKVSTISPSYTGKKILEAIDNGLSGETEIEGVGKFSPPSAYSWTKAEPKPVLSREEQIRRGKEGLIGLLCNSPKFKELATSLKRHEWQVSISVLSKDTHCEEKDLVKIAGEYGTLFKIEEIDNQRFFSCTPLRPEIQKETP